MTTSPQHSAGFTYLPDFTYATDPAILTDVEPGDAIHVRCRAGSRPEFIALVREVVRDEYGLHFRTEGYPHGVWWEGRASTTVDVITPVPAEYGNWWNRRTGRRVELRTLTPGTIVWDDANDEPTIFTGIDPRATDYGPYHFQSVWGGWVTWDSYYAPRRPRDTPTTFELVDPIPAAALTAPRPIKAAPRTAAPAPVPETEVGDLPTLADELQRAADHGAELADRAARLTAFADSELRLTPRLREALGDTATACALAAHAVTTLPATLRADLNV